MLADVKSIFAGVLLLAAVGSILWLLLRRSNGSGCGCSCGDVFRRQRRPDEPGAQAGADEESESEASDCRVDRRP